MHRPFSQSSFVKHAHTHHLLDAMHRTFSQSSFVKHAHTDTSSHGHNAPSVQLECIRQIRSHWHVISWTQCTVRSVRVHSLNTLTLTRHLLDAMHRTFSQCSLVKVKVQGFLVCKMTTKMTDKWVTSFRFNEIKKKKCLIEFLIDFIFCRLAETSLAFSISHVTSRKWRQSWESVRLPS